MPVITHNFITIIIAYAYSYITENCVKQECE